MSKKRVIFALYSSLVLIIAIVATVTVFTAVTYAGSCSKLTGFPGLLQRAGFFVSPCVSKIGGTVCGGGTACTTTDTKKLGTCKNIAAVGQAANCQCVENTVSKGL